MNKTFLKILSLLLAVLITVGSLPMQTHAAQTVPEQASQTITVSYVSDPDYNAQEYTDADTAAAYLSEQMQLRRGTITLYIRSTDENAEPLFHRIMDKALTHNDQPTAGDYLHWHRNGYRGSISYYETQGVLYYTFTYHVLYYTTVHQEEQLNNAVNALLAQLDLENKTDYEKVAAVYGYMAQNITYDFDNLEDDSYTLKYTAYAALIDKTAVCQGYANLFYRLMLELGVDCRIITGIGNGGGHAWNIVKLDGKYYDLDVTWDSQWVQAGRDYQYFLRCEENFGDHIRFAEYATTQFHADYPMGETDYTPVKYGDADGNNSITSADAALILQYVAGWPVQINAAAADVNCDGWVNSADAALILQYAAGWDVNLGAA